jgi:hypothetical protein
MDEKQKRAERELTELIEHCRELRLQFAKMENRLGRVQLGALGLDWRDLDWLVELEAGAQKGLEKLRKTYR